MSEPLVLLDTAARVRTITLNRPAQLNSFNNDLYWAAADAFVDAGADPGVAVVVITGTGRGFSAGQDIGEMGGSSSSTETRGNGFGAFTDGLAAFHKPVIAAVNGVAVGIGATMLPHCDLVFVSQAARIKTPFPTLGVCPEAASSVTFPWAMGWQQAAYTLFTADWLTADDAVRTGLAFRACEPDALMPEVMELATRIATMPIPSLVETKRLMVAGRLDMVMAARERENEAFTRLIGGPANREAISAFLEKRPADFSNLPEA
jgi:enoyl-CoA hydratase/carnithine racemase